MSRRAAIPEPFNMSALQRLPDQKDLLPYPVSLPAREPRKCRIFWILLEAPVFGIKARCCEHPIRINAPARGDNRDQSSGWRPCETRPSIRLGYGERRPNVARTWPC